MGWNPFAKPKPTPLCDALAKVTAEMIAAELAEPPEDHLVLSRIIAFRSMRTASGYLEILRKYLRVPDWDIIAFETLAFNAYAIRHAYNPMPRFGAEDFDEVDERYENLFDEDVNEAFKVGIGIVAKLAEQQTGWDDLLEITNRRLMHYGMAQSDEDMHSRFLKYIQNCQTAARPQITYETAPITNAKRNDQLTIMTLGYAYMHIPPEARAIDSVIEEYGFRGY